VSALGYVAAGNAVVWIGLWVFLLRIDARVAEKERNAAAGTR